MAISVIRGVMLAVGTRQTCWDWEDHWRQGAQ